MHKKILAALLFVMMIALIIGAYWFNTLEPYQDIPRVTLDRLNAGETAWHARGILDYRILVSIEFSSEQRQYEVVVRDGFFSDALSKRWDAAANEWTAFVDAPAEEAGFFTVPGMFAMLRTDLLNENVEREVLRLEIGPGHYPETIFLGRIIQEGQAVDGTELIVKVIEFEEIE